MKTIEDFMQFQKNHHTADNFKMITVGMLVLSCIFFTVIGKENTKSIIWYWVGFMTVLLIVNVILDVLAYSKDKK